MYANITQWTKNRNRSDALENCKLRCSYDMYDCLDGNVDAPNMLMSVNNIKEKCNEKCSFKIPNHDLPVLVQDANISSPDTPPDFDNADNNFPLDQFAPHITASNWSDYRKELLTYIYIYIYMATGTLRWKNDVDSRKAYYELQQIDKLTFYKNILKILYFIAVFVFIIKAIVIKRQFKNKFLWFITFILILFPFMLTYIRTLYLNVLSFIDNILPKNVYSDI